jgi:hypothetical protein
MKGFFVTSDWTLWKFYTLLNMSVSHIANSYKRKEQTDELNFAFDALVAMAD